MDIKRNLAERKTREEWLRVQNAQQAKEFYEKHMPGFSEQFYQSLYFVFRKKEVSEDIYNQEHEKYLNEQQSFDQLRYKEFLPDKVEDTEDIFKDMNMNEL